MRNNKIFKAIAIAAPVLLSASLLAETLTTKVYFSTVDDVSVAFDNEIVFGATIIPIAGRSCTMTPTITTASATAPVTTVALSGDGCSATATDAVLGAYALTGAADSEVVITLVGFADPATFSYEPLGTYMDGTAQTVINTTGTYTVDLDNTGAGYIILGGDLDINADMAFSDSFDADFTIEVTY